MSITPIDPTPSADHERRLLSTTAYGLTAVLLLFIIVLLPFSLNSVESEIINQSAPHFVITTSSSPGDAVQSSVHLTVTALNEWENTATVRVAIHQSCDRACPWGDRYLFVSVYGDSANGRGAQPSSDTVTLPATIHDVTESIRLPVYGDPIRYPFDRYRLVLGIVVDRLFPDGTSQTLDVTQAKDYATISLQARIPRAVMEKPVAVDAARLATTEQSEPFLVLEALTLERPLYLKILTVLLVLLVAAAAAYAVFLSRLEQLIIDSAALILGVWGIRSILLGTDVPGFTLVDLALTAVILFLLVTTTIRTLYRLEQNSRLQVLHRHVPASPAPAPTVAPVPADYVPPDRSVAYPNDAAKEPEPQPVAVERQRQ